MLKWNSYKSRWTRFNVKSKCPNNTNYGQIMINQPKWLAFCVTVFFYFLQHETASTFLSFFSFDMSLIRLIMEYAEYAPIYFKFYSL